MAFQWPADRTILARRTAIFTDRFGAFLGQATFWKYSTGWELIGATRRLRWIHDFAPADIPKESSQRHLKFRWRDECTQLSGRPEATTGVP